MWKRVPEYLKENILLLQNYLFLFDPIWMCFANFIKVPEMEKEKGSKKKGKGHHSRASQSQPMRGPSTSPAPARARSPPPSLSLTAGPHMSVPPSSSPNSRARHGSSGRRILPYNRAIKAIKRRARASYKIPSSPSPICPEP